VSPVGSIARLRSGRSPADRAAAALALVDHDHPDATSALAGALADTSPQVRANAALALASLRDPASIPALARVVAGWTGESQARCRRASLRTLAAFRSEEAAVELAAALAATSSDTPLGLEDRSALLSVVYAEPTGLAGARVVRTLIGMLAHEDALAADRAAQLLELFPAESYRPLARTLRSGRSPEMRRRAASALRACRHDEAISALLAALGDSVPAVRASAARSLGEMRDPAAAAALHSASEDADPGVREAARSALGELGTVAAATGLAAGFGPLVRGIA